MKYNKTAVDTIMHPEAKKISILRHPIAHFRSSWVYFNVHLAELRNVGREIKIFPEDSTPEQEMELFLENSNDLINRLSYDNPLFMFILNAQLGFFGYPRLVIGLCKKAFVKRPLRYN